MENIHFIQMQILKALLFEPGSRFSKLNSEGFPSDLFTYHVKSLVRDKLIEKDSKGGYHLTSKGKEFANRMDTGELHIAKQPKVAVMVIGERGRGRKRELLVQTRLKEPYYGYKGFVTGKVKFGEKIENTAVREFLEETGLEAKVEFKYLLHEHIYLKNGDLVEDKIFHVYRAYDVKGEIKDTKEGSSEWMSESNFLKDPHTFYDEKDILKWLRKPKSFLLEKVYVVESF